MADKAVLTTKEQCMSDSFDLQRFVDAQAAVYPQVVEQPSRGRKQTHWIWSSFRRLPELASKQKLL
jgi:uncharacterized protein (DUF1810 family)